MRERQGEQGCLIKRFDFVCKFIQFFNEECIEVNFIYMYMTCSISTCTCIMYMTVLVHATILSSFVFSNKLNVYRLVMFSCMLDHL